MTNSSTMMMGSKLKLQYLSDNHTGLGTKYRWTGKMMGVAMDFPVLVTKWLPGKEKVWETVGDAKLIIYSWYRMTLQLEPMAKRTKATLSITYRRPEGFSNNILSFLLKESYVVEGMTCSGCAPYRGLLEILKVLHPRKLILNLRRSSSSLAVMMKMQP